MTQNIISIRMTKTFNKCPFLFLNNSMNELVTRLSLWFSLVSFQIICHCTSTVNKYELIKKINFLATCMQKYQSIRNALLGALFPRTRSFFWGARQERVPFFRDRNETGTHSWYQRNEVVPRSSFLFWTNFDHENLEVLYYLKIRRVKAKSSILKCLNM